VPTLATRQAWLGAGVHLRPRRLRRSTTRYGLSGKGFSAARPRSARTAIAPDEYVTALRGRSAARSASEIAPCPLRADRNKGRQISSDRPMKWPALDRRRQHAEPVRSGLPAARARNSPPGSRHSIALTTTPEHRHENPHRRPIRLVGK
jgi:hypothetical protein